MGTAKYSRQTYQMVADILKDGYAESDGFDGTSMRVHTRVLIEDMQTQFETVFAEDNPRFDLRRFRAASGTWQGLSSSFKHTERARQEAS